MEGLHLPRRALIVFIARLLGAQDRLKEGVETRLVARPQEA